MAESFGQRQSTSRSIHVSFFQILFLKSLWVNFVVFGLVRGSELVAMKGQFYAFGGNTNRPHEAYTGATEVFFSSSQAWKKLQGTFPRDGLAAAAVGDSIYVMGGGWRLGRGSQPTI